MRATANQQQGSCQRKPTIRFVPQKTTNKIRATAYWTLLDLIANGKPVIVMVATHRKENNYPKGSVPPRLPAGSAAHPSLARKFNAMALPLTGRCQLLGVAMAWLRRPFSKALASAKGAKTDAKFLAVAPRDQNVGPGNSVATALLVARAGFTFTFILILNYCYSYPLFFTLHSLINYLSVKESFFKQKSCGA